MSSDPWALSNLTWHYTAAPVAALIGRDGVIKADTFRDDSSVLPIIWFSDCETYEPTASRMDGFDLDCRFGARKAITLPWPKLAVSAGMKWTERKRLEKDGRSRGANPDLWRGVVGGMLDVGSTLFQVHVDGDWSTTDIYSFSTFLLEQFDISVGPIGMRPEHGKMGREIRFHRRDHSADDGGRG